MDTIKTTAEYEAIIAALQSDVVGSASIIEHLTQRAEKAEADNAALTARVKELEHDLNGAKGNAKNALSNVDYWSGQTKALETQLAAARKALEFYANASKWDDGYFKSEDDGTVLRAYPSSIEKDQGNKARAALEVKP